MVRSPQDRLDDQALTSWKDIAHYLDRGIRTVQRWEVELGLPVRRSTGKKRGGVMALRPEIDDWLKACPISERARISQVGDFVQQSPALEAPEAPACSQVVLESRLVRRDLGRTRKDLSQAVHRITENCRRLEH